MTVTFHAVRNIEAEMSDGKVVNKIDEAISSLLSKTRQ